MMIGAPHVDHPIKTALELFQVVGDIRGEVGGLAVFPLHHPIFFIAEPG
jgi:hypothetical protein